MIKMYPNQWLTIAVGMFVVGFIVAAAITFFVMRNLREREINIEKQKKRSTPFIESVINRYASVMFDERYVKLTDRELIKMLRDTIWISLWLAHEASLRLTKKIERAETEKKA